MATVYDSFRAINKTTFSNACERVKEGLVLLGCGGDLNQWHNGVINMLTEANIACVTDFGNPLSLETTGGRIDLILPFEKEHKIQIGRLAMWRLDFGDCSWFSDYKHNYADDFYF